MATLLIREYIRAILEKKAKEVLGEPDFSSEDPEENEASTTAGIAGVITPLGTGPHYPDDEPDDREPAWKAAASGFGGAHLAKK